MSASTGAVRNQVGISFVLPCPGGYIFLLVCVLNMSALVPWFCTSKLWPFLIWYSQLATDDPKIQQTYVCSPMHFLYEQKYLGKSKIFYKNIILLNVFYWYCFRFIVLYCFILFYCFNVFLFFLCFLIFSFVVVYRGVPVRAPTGLLRFNQGIDIST